MGSVDVSKCEHYDNGKCNCYYEEMNYEIFSKDNCVEHSDCYYKQLHQLKAENEELKKQLQEESDLGHQAVQEEADSFFEVLKYEQCLDEIKEQIEDIISEKCNIPCEKCTGKPLCDKYYILQKIKEVKGK